MAPCGALHRILIYPLNRDLSPMLVLTDLSPDDFFFKAVSHFCVEKW